MAAQDAPTFVRRDGEILAFYKGECIARDTNYAKCEQSAVEYLDGLTKKKHMEKEHAARQAATHVEGPNGLKGEILGNVEGQWGRELTVRWENGRITRHASRKGDGLEYKTAEETPHESALEYLESTLNQVPEGTKSSLYDRISVLDGLVLKANAAMHTANYEESKALDDIVLQAQHEKHEVREALAHLEMSDAEAFAPPETYAVKEASLGGGNGSWLDDVSDQMTREAAETDYDKLLLEGPVEFVAELPTAVLAEAGTTQSLAHEFITAKIAAVEHLAMTPEDLARMGPSGQGQMAQPPGAPISATPAQAQPNMPGMAPGQPHPNASPSGTQAQPAPGAPPNPELQALQGAPSAPNQFIPPNQGIMSSVNEYHDSFLARVELARRDELKDRQKTAKKAAKKTAKKEAKVEKKEQKISKKSGIGDEGLFL